MIRALAPGKDGPVLILGVTAENVRRLRNNQPITVEIGEMIRLAAQQTGDVQQGRLTVAIMYGETHADVVSMLQEAGVALPPNALADAVKLDGTL